MRALYYYLIRFLEMESLEVHFVFFFHGCNFLQAVTVTFFFPVFVLFVLKLGIMGLVLNGCSMRFMSYCLTFMAI